MKKKNVFVSLGCLSQFWYQNRNLHDTIDRNLENSYKTVNVLDDPLNRIVELSVVGKFLLVVLNAVWLFCHKYQTGINIQWLPKIDNIKLCGVIGME